jgi:hypothetical protein
MATETTKEEVIIEFKIDQGQALSDLKKTEKAILDNKEAQKELNDQYKKNLVTQEEYINESIKLQRNLKTEQDNRRTLGKLIDTESNSRNALKARVAQLTKEYDNLNVKTKEGKARSTELEKELSILNAQITKTSKSAGLFKDQIGNYPHQFGEAAKSINVAGVSVGDLGTKLMSFANPATAAVGIVSALGAAYARSTIGAKDLEFASNQLSTALTISTNAFANLISSAKDGEGILSKLVGGLLFQISPGLAILSSMAAQSKETLEDLGRTELEIRDKVNDRLETNQELLSDLGDAQVSYDDKLFKSGQIIDNLRANEEELLKVKKDELQELQFQLALDKENEDLQTIVLEKQLEISKIEKDTTKQVEKILRLKENLTSAEEKRLEALRKERDLLNDIDRRSAGGNAKLSGDAKDQQVESDIKKSFAIDESKTLIDINQYTQESITKFTKSEEQKRFDEHQKYIEARRYADEEELAYTADAVGALSQLFKKGGDEYKAVASLQTIISTYAGAQKAYESQASIPYVGPELGAVAAAAAVVEGLARLAVINGIQFAEGGYTGSGGKYEPAGVVHKGEVVWNQRDVAMAGGPQIANMMRPTYKGYADGGIVTSSLTMDTNTALMQANAIKMMPNPVVSVKEITLAQQRIQVKENISTL